MKRFWLVLLSLGLIMAFSASAFAVDVKFSGTYYAAGAYVDKISVYKNSTNDKQSSAFYFQKLQLTTEFVASPGLSLVTRANIMERVWGNTRSATGTALDTASAATRAENENIGFDYAYINYTSPIGIWKVGYMSDSTWGTIFGDSSTPRGKISYTLPIGNFAIGASIVKYNENSANVINTTDMTDNDKDKYGLTVNYTAKNWAAGLLGSYYSDATSRSASPAYKGKYYNVQPYAKAKIGPVAIEAELSYYFGKYAEYETAGNTDKDVNSLSGYVDVLGTFGPVYVGGTFAYAQGQGDNADKVNTLATGGFDWNPTLILFNQDMTYWVSSSNYGTGNAMTNAFLYQVRAGVKPTDKLDIGASVAFAQKDTVNAQTDTASYVRASKDIGWEIDVTGTYKITNNLSYMLGVGYLIPGDYYKGNDKANEITNTYLVINKLALTF